MPAGTAPELPERMKIDKRAIIRRYIVRHKEITGCDVTLDELAIIFDKTPDEILAILEGQE